MDWFQTVLGQGTHLIHKTPLIIILSVECRSQVVVTFFGI